MADLPTPEPLQPIREDWQRALAVVAHPDDLEFGATAAVARWTGQGKHVAYVLLTSGEAGIDSMAPDETRKVREAEQRAAAALVGVDDVTFLGLPDGILEYGVPLRRLVAGEVRRHRPDIVITNNFRDTWDGASAYNQPDHIVAGRATFDGARDAANRWLFAHDGQEPWAGVRQVWAASSPESRHGVDVTDTFRQGVASLEAHAAYLQALGGFDAEEFLESLCRGAGTRLGTRFGCAFEVFDLRG